jgi:signal peptidase I
MVSLSAFFKSRLERHARREAMFLVRDARRVLEKHPDKVPAERADEIRQVASTLETAWKQHDADTLKTKLSELEQLSEKHLAFARKSHSRELTESIVLAILVALLLRAFVLEAFKIPSGSMIPTLEIGDRIFVDKVSYGIRIPGTTKRLFYAREPRRGEVIVFMNPCTPERDFIKRVIALGGDTVEVRCDVVYVNGQAIPTEHAVEDAECTFWEKREEIESEPWQLKQCAHYLETVGDKVYSTYHSPRRPLDEAERKTNPAEAADEGDNDFPGNRLPYCRENPRVAPVGVIEDVPGANESTDLCGQRRRYVVPEGYVFAMGDNRAHSSDSRDWGPVPIENIKGRALFVWWASQRENLIRPDAERDRPGSPWLAEWNRIGKIVK